MTSNFLADIPIGFFTHSSISTTKSSGITLRISLFGRSTPLLDISRALSISSEVISHPTIATTHLFFITSRVDELNETYAQITCSPAIFSASSKDLSKLFLNSSISRIFHFLIAFEEDIQTHRMLKFDFLVSLSKYQITVLIFELPISIAVIVLYWAIFSIR
jgi:hypothetical protein